MERKNRVDSERYSIVLNDELVSNYSSTQMDFSLALPDRSLTMSWEHLDVGVNVTPPSRSRTTANQIIETNKLLLNVFGHVVPGQILAIMGSSGAGKTTLLNVLSGRASSNLRVSGTIYLNGQRVDETILRNACGYIEQHDLFIGSMTVREHLTFQAMLRMQTNTDQYRYDRITDVLKVLDLTACQNTLIGIPGRLKGLSDGELRRLMFASVVLTNPSLLLIDEPTSGVDSQLARSIMDCLRRLADQGKTIITVLHQPSSLVFQTVDSLCLLAHGHLAYFGSRVAAQDFFASMDRHCPPHCNPAEQYIEQLSDVHDDLLMEDHPPVESERSALDWTEAVTKFQQSKYYNELQEQIATMKSSEKSRSNELSHAIDYQSSFWRQLKWLLWRSFLSSSRNPVHSSGLLLKSVVPAIILGLLFFRLEQKPEIVQNLNAISFAILTTVSYTNAFVILAIFPTEFQVFLKEHRRRLYGTSAYYIARFLSELPFFIVMPWLFTTVIYILVGIDGSLLTYLSYCAFTILAANAAVGFSGIIAAVAGSVDSAVALAVPLLETLMLFGGFFLNNASVPFYFRWLQYCTWYYYAYSLMLILLWGHVASIPCSSIGFCLSTGTDVLGYYHVDEHLVPFYLVMLFVLIVVYHLIAFLIIWIRVRRN